MNPSCPARRHADPVPRGLVLRQLMDVYARNGQTVVALEAVYLSKVGQYGVIGGRPIGDGLHLVESAIEKPAPDRRRPISPSPSATCSVADFTWSGTPPRGKGNAVGRGATDALKLMVRDVAIYGLLLEGSGTTSATSSTS